MTLNDDQIKKSKKFAVGDLPPSPTTSTGTITTTTTTTNKRPTRHHVKRRSSGRVHVSKLAPMARAHSNNNDDNEERKPMKRSQSNKSLTRLSSLERKGGMTGFTPAVSNNTTKNHEHDQPQPEADHVVEEHEEKVISPHSPPTTPPQPPTTATPLDKKPTFHVSHTIPAAPIEQPLHVTADNLVVPDKKATAPSSNTAKKPLLKSQFVEHANGSSSSNKKVSNVASAAIAQQPSGITRTQQKLLLQREQSLIHDENNIAHPKNMIRLTREMEKMGKEYRCVRKYQDPMMESLVRCQQALDKTKQPPKKPMLQQRTFSTAVIPTIHNTANATHTHDIPHMEQRRQILLKTALHQQQQQQQLQQQQKQDDYNNRWSAERLFYGTS
ncbi:hypothetical protein MBANPS3_006506 [Mucor bainieri]